MSYVAKVLFVDVDQYDKIYRNICFTYNLDYDEMVTTKLDGKKVFKALSQRNHGIEYPLSIIKTKVLSKPERKALKKKLGKYAYKVKYKNDVEMTEIQVGSIYQASSMNIYIKADSFREIMLAIEKLEKITSTSLIDTNKISYIKIADD